MLNSENNVPHLDGTELKLEEKGSYQIVTSSGSYSIAFEDMEGGDAVSFLDSFRNVLSEMAELLVGTNDEKDQKAARSKCGGRRRFHRLQLISRRLLRLRISYILIDFRVFRKTFNYASGFTHKCQA